MKLCTNCDYRHCYAHLGAGFEFCYYKYLNGNKEELTPFYKRYEKYRFLTIPQEACEHWKERNNSAKHWHS